MASRLPHGPGQEAPVHEGLRQRHVRRHFGLRLHLGKQGRRTGEVHQGSAAAQNAPPPASSAHMITAIQLKVLMSGRLSTPPRRTRPQRLKPMPRLMNEGRQHQDLPVQAEHLRRPGEQGADQRRHGVDVHQGRRQEAQQEAAADGQQRPVHALHKRGPRLLAAARAGISFMIVSSLFFPKAAPDLIGAASPRERAWRGVFFMAPPALKAVAVPCSS